MTGEAKKWLKFRIFTLLVFFIVLFVALISRAFQIQVLSRESLKSLAVRQHIKTLYIEPERGIIFDRNGEKLAASILVDSICADPSKISNPSETAVSLASILKMDKDTILKKLSGSKNFCWLARKIPPDQAASVEALNIDGVFLTKEPKRFYPNGELAGRLIGFVGLDSTGLEGMELKYENYLKGSSEKLIWARDAKGKRLYPRVENTAAKKEESHNLILTIDSRIQHLVETKLSEAIASKSAKGGFAVVMDPKTGEILALADQPGFDPNKFGSYNVGKGKNKVITDCFDPGSTFKPFLAAAALEEGIAKETDRFNCENGAYAIADRVFHEANRKRYGSLAFRDVIKYSSNIGCVKISEKLGKEKFYEYITKFGFGSKTGIDLPGESGGILRPVHNWTRVDTSTIAFGQGVSVTAIQLITALSAIANQGVLMKPYIVRAIVDKKGQIVKKVTPTPVRTVTSPATAKRMTAILTGVVGDHDGTGKRAQIMNVSVAGKTGTSQKFDFGRRVYSSERVRTSFMGFFPAEDPQVAILVTLDEPQRDKWGGVAAAPVFKNIGEQILTCFKTNIRETPSPAPEEEKINNGVKIRLVSLPGSVNRQIASEDASVMPDFRGMSMRDALKRAKEKGIEIQVMGSGWAIGQDPKPGAVIPSKRTCAIHFSTGN
ncbi:MAG: penicillin-binding transpeptidase domain-containing protein [Deltaproteobacteria bacterium]|nr:penicillin-binding transpeptidase domain-containing protein [Deltaproteobacteria bacterium]